MMARATLSLTVNGKAHSVKADPDTPLLYVLRNDLGLQGLRFGCGLAQCGACTVLVDGNPVRSCIVPASAVQNLEIRTLEGIGTPENPHPVQRAFIAEQAAQCGYCLPGWILYSVALLEKNPRPTDADIRQQFSGLKCRCATQTRFIRAVRRAAQWMA